MTWEQCFRDGFAPSLSSAGLEALATAIRHDDGRLLQGATCSPPPMLCVQDWPVEGADAIAFCGWQDGLDTVGEVEDFFARACHEADLALKEPAACRYFLRWFDDVPRKKLKEELLPVIESILKGRQ